MKGRVKVEGGGGGEGGGEGLGLGRGLGRKCAPKSTRTCEKLRPHREAIEHAHSMTRKRASSQSRWKSLSRGVKLSKGMSASEQMLQLSASRMAATTTQRQQLCTSLRLQIHAAASSSTAGAMMERPCWRMIRPESMRRGAWAREMVGSRKAKKARRRFSEGSCVRVTSLAYVISAWRANEEPSKRLVNLFCRSSRWRSLTLTPAARLLCRVFSDEPSLADSVRWPRACGSRKSLVSARKETLSSSRAGPAGY